MLVAVIVAALVIADLAGAMGLTQCIRLGTAAVGAVALGSVLRVLSRALLEEPQASGAAVSIPGAALRRYLDRLVSFSPGRRGRHLGLARREATELSRTEALVRLSEQSEADFHVRLKPRLRPLVESRLMRAGIDLSDKERVSALLGPVPVLATHRSSQASADSPGVPAAELCELLRRIEGLDL